MNQRRATAYLGLAALATVAVATLAVQELPGHATAQAQSRRGGTSAGQATYPRNGDGDSRPNILYIVTDDEAISDFTPQTMPQTYRFLVDGGTVYSNSISSYSYCCPSRASFQTGQFAHNHGTISCRPGNGFDYFMAHTDQRRTLPNWLRDAGYSTGFTGKFINGNEGEPFAIPGGWTDWHGFNRGTYNYFFQTTTDRTPGHPAHLVHHHKYSSYTTGDITSRMIRQLSRRPKPWFIEAAFVAPHMGADDGQVNPPHIETPGVPSRYLGEFDHVPMYKNPSYNEADTSDKNPRERGYPLITPELQQEEQQGWAQRQEAIRSVDQEVGRLVRQLRRMDELHDTVIIFTSDNGYALGQHRQLQGKMRPYAIDQQVPLVIRGPGFPAGATRDQVVENNDVTTTIAALAHARPTIPQDGISILPSRHHPGWMPNRAVLTEQFIRMKFHGVWTQRYSYFEEGPTRFRELYDHAVDPFELNNVADKPAYRKVVRRLHRTTHRLWHCAGSSCHASVRVDDLVPLPQARRIQRNYG